jgi:hypothetical protein
MPGTGRRGMRRGASGHVAAAEAEPFLPMIRHSAPRSMPPCSLQIVALLLVSPFVVGCAAPPGKQVDGNWLPIVEFDVAQANAMLTGGKARIEGVAVAKENDTPFTGINLSTGHWAQPGTRVVLFPRTSYFDQYLALRDEYERAAQISAEAFSYRRETQVGTDGQFVFTDLGPGEYYLEAVIQYVQATEQNVQTGTQYTTIRGSNPHVSWEHVHEDPIYTTVYGSYVASKLAKGYVTIDPGDESVSIKIRN